MGMITANLNAAIRERCDSRELPAKYAKLPMDFRLSEADATRDLVLFREDMPEVKVLLGRTGRDEWGRRWFLNPGWRDEVKALVAMLGMEKLEITEEVPF